jgi:hypothetical protein
MKKTEARHVIRTPFMWGIPVISLCAGHVLGEKL